MSAPDRSIADILREILDALQDLLRAELALARQEVTADLGRARTAVAALIVGTAASLIGGVFLLWALVYALSLRLPLWGAAGCVGGVLLLIGIVLVSRGLGRWRRLSFEPERTVATLKENVAWLSQSSK